MIKKTIILVSATLCFYLIGYTQEPYFEWAKQMGGKKQDIGNSLVVDEPGYVYTTGGFTGLVDFDPGMGIYNLTSAGDSDIFIQKLDASGNFVWVKQFGSGGIDIGMSITVDNFGNLYTTGCFSDTVDFDPGYGIFNLISAGIYDIFIQKLDSFGNFVWAKKMGGKYYDRGFAIILDDLGNVYTTGDFSDTVDFDPGNGIFHLTEAGCADVFIQKLDSSGNFIWAKQIAGNHCIRGNSIAIDTSGNVCITGRFMGTADFDPGPGTFNLICSGFDDIFIQKLDADGNFIWAKQMGAYGLDRGNSIAFDNLGNVYTTGFFSDTVDFDPGPGKYNLVSSNGSHNIFVQKLDSSGNFVWAIKIGKYFSQYGNSIVIDRFSNVYITGEFIGAQDFDPGPDTFNLVGSGFYHVFVLKLDSSGNFKWANKMGGSEGRDGGNSITLDDSDNIYTTGFFSDTADFDPGHKTYNLSSNGTWDVFVCKWRQCSNSTNISVNECDFYTSPSGNYIWTTSGIYLDTIPNAVECDSVITIHLTMQRTSSTTNETVCDSYVSPSGKYVWTTSGTYLDTIPNAVKCDSAITIHLAIQGTSNTINKTVCDSYVSPSGKYVWTTSGTYLDTIPNSFGCDSLITIHLILKNDNSSSVIDTACYLYTSPSGKHTWASSGTFTDTILNSFGCDSIITINLTINIVDTSVTQIETTLSANATGATYQWLDCNNGYSPISGETNQSFNPTIDGSYAAEVTQNSCIDTSDCYSVTIIGIIENSYPNEISVYPNPTDDKFIIDLGYKYGSINVTITDIKGKVIQNSEYKQRQLLNLSIDKARGLYIVKIETGDHQAVIRLIKE